MKLPVLHLTEWRALAVAALVAFIPVTAGNYAVDNVAYSEAGNYINRDAALVLRRVEYAIDRAVSVLHDGAGLRLGEHCNARKVMALQQLVTGAWMIKEMEMRGEAEASGIACSNTGLRPAVGSEVGSHTASDPSISLRFEMVTGLRHGALRVLLKEPGIGELSALMPLELMMPERQSLGHKDDHFVTVAFSQGEPIITIEGRPSTMAEAPMHVSKVSSRYPIQVDVHSYPSVILKNSEQVYQLARLVSAFVGLMFGLMFYIYAKRREGDAVFQMEMALDRHEFIPYYQPIINLKNGNLAGCEVLARWRKRDGTMVPPVAFIDTAEKSGFIFPLTLELMRIAARELGPVYFTRPSLKCGFNLCAEHFKDDAIVHDVHSIFDDSALRLTQLYFEVTERDPLPDMALARSIIADFQGSGMRVALDDVGTGHGGMSYLLKLGVNMMKIDKLFIDGLGHGDASGAIIDSLLDLARNMNLDVVAEGVETAAQVEELRRRGVNHAQGYFFAQPMSGADYVKLVESMAPVESMMEELIVRDLPDRSMKLRSRRFA